MAQGCRAMRDRPTSELVSRLSNIGDDRDGNES